MAALTSARKIVQYGQDMGKTRAIGVGTAVTIYHGALIMTSGTGYATPASTTSPTAAIGVAKLDEYDSVQLNGQPMTTLSTLPNYVANAGADDAVKIVLIQGSFIFNNKAGDLVTRAMIGADVFIEDDQTVRATGAASAKAGVLKGFNDAGLPIVQVFKA